MIKVENLTCKFDDNLAVNDLSFTIERGEVVGFLGPNGAGKSTTMRMLTGFLPMTAGTVQLDDMDIVANSLDMRKRIGYLPEGAPLYTEMSVFRFLSFIAEIRGIDRKDRLPAIEKVSKQLHLDKVLNKPIETLSKGFKRRVGIAQALIHDPEVLILDEPTDGLDPNQKHQIRTLISKMARDKIIIISTHILEEVTAVCNRAIIIANGCKCFDGKPDELLQKSKYFNAVTLKMSYIADISGIMELEQVADIEFDKALNRITVISENNQDIMQVIQKFVQANKLPVDYIFPEQGRLDEVFRSITKQARDSE